MAAKSKDRAHLLLERDAEGLADKLVTGRLADVMTPKGIEELPRVAALKAGSAAQEFALSKIDQDGSYTAGAVLETSLLYDYAALARGPFMRKARNKWLRQRYGPDWRHDAKQRWAEQRSEGARIETYDEMAEALRGSHIGRHPGEDAPSRSLICEEIRGLRPTRGGARRKNGAQHRGD